jgi:uncharacterized protein (DUF302 family)
MQTIGSYAFEVTTRRGFDETLVRVRESLAAEGFGVLTEIDVQATLREKLGVETVPYRILGACNPPFAHRALAVEPHIGVLLPCNVVVWDAGDHRVVSAMEPALMGSIVDSPEVSAIAREVSGRLHRVLERLD